MNRPAGAALAWLLASVLFGWGCTAPAPQGGWAGWREEPLQWAEFFQLWHRGGDHLLLTFGPGGTKDTTGIFVLQADTGKGALPPGAVRFGRPLGRVALLSTTHASFISALGMADAVAGCAHTARLRDPLVAARAAKGRIAEIGTAEGLDREKVASLAPDAVIVYPYGTEAASIAQVAVPSIPVAEYLERDPLGRAEWLRAFGLLLGRSAEAEAMVEGIAARYGKALASVPEAGHRPVVFFGSSWRGSWSVPSGKSYMAKLIGDAGGSYLFGEGDAGGNQELTLETVVAEGARAECWGRILELDRPVTAADVAGDDPRILALPAFTGHGCFYANSTESDLFGQASLEPDVILLDLIGLFHPGLRGGRQPVYFKPVQ